jgi:hypothetical protein
MTLSGLNSRRSEKRRQIQMEEHTMKRKMILATLVSMIVLSTMAFPKSASAGTAPPPPPTSAYCPGTHIKNIVIELIVLSAIVNPV